VALSAKFNQFIQGYFLDVGFFPQGLAYGVSIRSRAVVRGFGVAKL